MIAIVPKESDLRVHAALRRFLRDVASHRLFFVVGAAWSTRLHDLFDHVPGLSIPSQFIRVTGNAPETMEAMIAEAQRVFSNVTAGRAEQILSLAQAARCDESLVHRRRSSVACGTTGADPG